MHQKGENYEATRLHFENLRRRYGDPIIILNLIKVSLTLLFQSSSILCNIYIPGHEWYFGMPSHIYFCCSHGKKRERRESILRREFDRAIRIINKSIPEENHLRFLHWDLHENSQGYWLLFFFSISHLPVFYSVHDWSIFVLENLQMCLMFFWKWRSVLWGWLSSSIVNLHHLPDLILLIIGLPYCKFFFLPNINLSVMISVALYVK